MQLVLSKYLLAYSLSIMVLLTPINICADERLENKIQAAFIFNFIKFTKWPDSLNLRSIKVCVQSDASIFSELETMQSKIVRGIPVIVVGKPELDNLEECQIVYFSKTESRHTKTSLQQIRGKPILTIGDSVNFTLKGGIIQFFLDSNRVRFEINIDEAKNSRLNISSKLLSLSRKATRKGMSGR